jgi:hypothetical protein
MNMPTLVVEQTSFPELGYSGPVICDNSNEIIGTAATREGRRQERETYILTEENMLVLFVVVAPVRRIWPDSSLSLVLYDLILDLGLFTTSRVNLKNQSVMSTSSKYEALAVVDVDQSFSPGCVYQIRKDGP